jgi:Heterocyst differentiation regulator C-terminal Hood domain/Peptidase family S48
VHKTPFNLGKDIVLSGFEFERSRLLAEGLANVVSNPEAVLQQILTWTGGQPFLTQKLCDLIQMGGTELPTLVAGEEVAWVAELVRSRIIDNWEAQDNPQHLKTIRDRVIRNELHTSQLLHLYEKVLQKEVINADGSAEQIELCLSGLVVEQRSKLRTYNLIYKTVFNYQWVQKELAALQPDARIKTIFDEINQALIDGNQLRQINAQDPYYLNQVPYVWIERYPLSSEKSRILDDILLAPEEIQELEDFLPSNLPNAQVIGSSYFFEIIRLIHMRAQENWQGQQKPAFSQATVEYIEKSLVDSGTVQRVDNFCGRTLYVLLTMSYSPYDKKERTYVMVEEAARYFRFLKAWEENQVDTLRITEWLNIDPENLSQALHELDDIIREWADKYHIEDGKLIVLQAMIGPDKSQISK